MLCKRVFTAISALVLVIPVLLTLSLMMSSLINAGSALRTGKFNDTIGVMGVSSLRYLFVYGTLRKGSGNPHARRLAEHAEWAGPGRIPGRLYRLGRYPGLKLLRARGR